MNDDEKRIQNLFKTLQKDSRSVFYSSTILSNNLLKKLKKSRYQKDQVFAEPYQRLEDKNFNQEQDQIPLTTPFFEKKGDVDRSTLYSIGEPFKKVHADIADLRFLAKLAVDPKYALLAVDLFSSKIYVYPMKNRSLLAKKLKLFYDEIDSKRNGKMTLQTDLEFNQNAIKILNKEFSVEMFYTRVRGGKAFAAEQKICEFKKILLQSKSYVKRGGKRIRPNELIKKAVQNMNEANSTKYSVSPETVENRTIESSKDSEFNREMYEFLRLKKVDNNQQRNTKYESKKDRRQRKLRNPLYLDEKVLVFAERLKKKDAPSKFYKASTDNIPFFNREKLFTIYKRAKLDNGSCLYWLDDENQNKVEDRFLRQELFALNKQFER